MTQEVYDTIKAMLGEPLHSIQSGPDIYAFWTPVTDRVLADCVYGNPKGSLSPAVCNRVAANLEFCSYLLKQLGNSIIPPAVATWSRNDYVFVTDLEAFHSQYAACTAIVGGSALPDIPTQLSFVYVNMLEECTASLLLTIEGVQTALELREAGTLLMYARSPINI